jgi:hypothetical protein
MYFEKPKWIVIWEGLVWNNIFLQTLLLISYLANNYFMLSLFAGPYEESVRFWNVMLCRPYKCTKPNVFWTMGIVVKEFVLLCMFSFNCVWDKWESTHDTLCVCYGPKCKCGHAEFCTVGFVVRPVSILILVRMVATGLHLDRVEHSYADSYCLSFRFL